MTMEIKRFDLQDVVNSMTQKLELAEQRGYRQCLQDIRGMLDALDAGNAAAKAASTKTMIANGGDSVIAPSLGPVSARAVDHIYKHPGATRADVRMHAGVRGEGLLADLCAAGFIRKEVLPVEQRKPGESYVRYYPA